MKLFIKSQGCPLCSLIKPYIELLKQQFKDDFQVYDTDTIEGMSEACYWDVYSVPTLIVGRERYLDKECLDYIRKIVK